MISLRLTLLLLIIGALILSGIVEVRLHPERARNFTAGLGALEMSTAPAQIKSQALMFKRNAEQRLLKDEQRRVDLALAALGDDLESLKTKLEQPEATAALLVPDLKLLNNSLGRLDQLAADVSVDTLAAMFSQSQELRQQARDLEPQLATLANTDHSNSAFTDALAEFQGYLNPVNEPAEPGESSDPADSAADAADTQPSPSTAPLAF